VTADRDDASVGHRDFHGEGLTRDGGGDGAADVTFHGGLVDFGRQDAVHRAGGCDHGRGEEQQHQEQGFALHIQ
jgi:hypothetical protein